jgi:dihydroorotase
VTILDPELSWTFDARKSKSRSRNTPFDGWTLRGSAVATIVAGRIVYKHPELKQITERNESHKREAIEIKR